MSGLKKDQVIGKLRSVLYLDDAIPNQNPKFHTVAVHEAECARWAAVEIKDANGNRSFEVARFTPGVLKRAMVGVDKNYDDFENRDDTLFDEELVKKVHDEKNAFVAAHIAELEELQKEVKALREANSLKEELIAEYAQRQLAAEDTLKKTIQKVTDDLIEASTSKGWFSGDYWWKRVMKSYGAKV